MTLVIDSSPTRPVLPSIPENTTLISMGPAILVESTIKEVFANPKESVMRLDTTKPSTITSKPTKLTGNAELSIRDNEILISWPRTTRLSGSKSRGLRIVSSE